MKRIAFIFLATLIMISCEEQSVDPNQGKIKYPDARIKLDQFIQDAKTSGLITKESFKTDLSNFMKAQGFSHVTHSSEPAYQKMLRLDEINLNEAILRNNRSGRLPADGSSCVVTAYGGFSTSDGSYVFVYYLGSGCYHSDCILNSWWSGDTHMGYTYVC